MFFEGKDPRFIDNKEIRVGKRQAMLNTRNYSIFVTIVGVLIGFFSDDQLRSVIAYCMALIPFLHVLYLTYKLNKKAK